MTKRYTRAAEMGLMRSALDAFDANVVGPRCGPAPETVVEMPVSARA
jgi:hypothetical protein